MEHMRKQNEAQKRARTDTLGKKINKLLFELLQLFRTFSDFLDFLDFSRRHRATKKSKKSD